MRVQLNLVLTGQDLSSRGPPALDWWRLLEGFCQKSVTLRQGPVGRTLGWISAMRLSRQVVTTYSALVHPGLEVLLSYQVRASSPWLALGAGGVFPVSRAALSLFQQDLAYTSTSVYVSACLCVWGAGFAGTPGYLSPEVLRKDPYGKPVDLWACGESI